MVMLTQEFIDSLPVLNEEELKRDYYDESLFEDELKSLLEEFNNDVKKIDNFHLENWVPTPVEQALMSGTFDKLLNESTDVSFENIPNVFLEIQDFDAAMEDIKSEIDKQLHSEEEL